MVGSGEKEIYLVSFRPEASVDEVDGLVSTLNVRRRYKLVRAASILATREKAELLKSNGCVKAVEPNREFKAIPVTYSDEKEDDDGRWNIEKVQGPQCWEETKAGEGTTIAIIDTGIDYNHVDLEDNFGDVKGHNFVADDDDPMDDNGHGTHCAGIADGTGKGKIRGVASRARLYAVKVLDERGSGTLEGVVAGIEWSVENGADVLSLSLGTGEYSEILDDACKAAYDEGKVIVAAAGNEILGPSYPAYNKTVISVAATDRNDKAPYWGNKDNHLSISCPGVDILSCMPGNKYQKASGTSMACPHGAGGASVYVSDHPGASPDEVRAAFEGTAKKLGHRFIYGKGLMQAYDAAMKPEASVPC